MGSMWDIASAIIKWGNYLSMAIVIGGGFSFALMSHIEPKLKEATLRYIFVGCVLGICTTVLFFISQVGGINQQGLSGAFDFSMMQIIFQSDIGLQTGMRLASFIFSFLFLWRLKKQLDRNSNSPILRTLPLELYLPITIMLAISFAVIGHVSQLGLIARFAIVAHVICVFLWIGALYPLYLICASKHGSKVAGIMKEFGKYGAYFVSAILLSGTFLLFQLFGSVSEFVTTSYGNAVLLKLVLVVFLLVLAAINKFRLSPSIEKNGAVLKLRNSILLEIVFATVIAAITTYFTTVIGIAHG
jgi:putative copper resistance protein D